MILIILKTIVALYGATKLLGAKGTSKDFFDSIDFKANRFLSSLKDENVHTVLWGAYRLLFKFNIFLIATFAFLTIFFKPLSTEFVTNWTNIFTASILITICVPWNLDHVNFVKKHFLNTPLVWIPALPLLALGIQIIFGVDFLGPLGGIPPFAYLYNYVDQNIWLFAVSLSLISFAVYILIPYMIFWIVLFPMFYLFLWSTKVMQLSLNFIHRHMNENILAVIMGLATVVLASM